MTNDNQANRWKLHPQRLIQIDFKVLGYVNKLQQRVGWCNIGCGGLFGKTMSMKKPILASSTGSESDQNI